MRRRKHKSDPEAKLVKLGTDWRKAVTSGKYQQADKCRQKAEILFKELTEFREKPPVRAPKMLYIDWIWFVRWNEPAWRKGYIRAVEQNKWPARPVES